MKNKLNQDQS